MIPLRTIPPLNILYTILNNAGIVLNLDAELNHMRINAKSMSGVDPQTSFFSFPDANKALKHTKKK